MTSFDDFKRDFNPEYITTRHDGMSVAIEKVGGGTIGNQYPKERWAYVIYKSGEPESWGSDMVSGYSNATHVAMADLALEMWDDKMNWMPS